MNEYQVLARKYRPQTFHDVVAQTPIVETLKNAIHMQRTAHAYLFCGSRGTGKTTLARLFAKALNCANLSVEIEPCGHCSSCREIAAGHAIDVLEIDGASHRGIEDIRQINETIGFSPIGGRHKIYLIDEVHMLTKEAFNALLKTLEEPPPHAKFFFCTTEPHKIPATILSRCQRFNLRRIPLDKISGRLAQIAAEGHLEVEKEALERIAELSEGSLRDSLSLFDQIIAFSKGAVTTESVIDALGLPSEELLFSLAAYGEKQEWTAAFKIAGELFDSGKNLSYFLEELISHFRTLLLLKNGVPSPRQEKRYAEIAPHYKPEQLIQILELLTEGQQTLKSAPSERTALEMLLLKILKTHRQVSLDTLVQRLLELEGKLAAASTVQAPPKKSSISEDPIPKPEELPKAPKAAKPTPPPIKAQPPPPEPIQPLPIQEQCRFDTVMRFAAKELNGSLKKE